jgi:hypothetical protein
VGDDLAEVLQAVRPGRDVGQGALGLDPSADQVGVIALVAVQHASSRQALQELFGGLAIGGLTAGQQESDGPTEAVG